MIKKQFTPFTYVVKHLIKFPTAIIALLLITVGFVVEISALPYITKNIIELLSNNKLDDRLINLLLRFLMISFACNVVISICYRLEDYFIVYNMVPKMRRALNLEILDVLMLKNCQYYQKTASGELVVKITDIMDSMPEMIRIFFANVFKVICGIIITSGPIFCIHPVFGILLNTTMGLFVTITILYGRVVRKSVYNFFNTYSIISGRVGDFINCFVSFRLFSPTGFQRANFHENANQLFGAEKTMRLKMFTLFSLLAGTYLVSIFCNLCCMFYLLKNGHIRPSDCVLILGVNHNIVGWLFYACYNMGKISEYIGQISQALDLIFNTQDFEDVPNLYKLEVGDQYDIELQNVNFGYADSMESLKDISMEIPSGAKVAFVGASGSGKSTLIKLISRVYRQDSGKILVGGHNISNASRESLIETISVVTQDFVFFNRSIKSNLLYFDQSKEAEAMMVEICKSLQIHDTILKNGGYDAHCPDNFSGGEYQRLNIARALLNSKAKILLLDEHTANLDKKSKKSVHTLIRKISEERKLTVVVIAHDLELMGEMDTIYVLENGEIVDHGKHEDLRNSSKVYSGIFGLKQSSS